MSFNPIYYIHKFKNITPEEHIIIIEPLDLPTIVFDNLNDAQCSENHDDICPMINFTSPTPNIGCEYCRAIKDIILSWDYLYSHIESINSINSFSSFNDFYCNYPQISNDFKIQFSNSSVDLDRLFLEVQFLAQKRVSYGINILINKSTQQYTIYNGRHRIQMAKILNIAVPVRLIIKY